MPPAPLFDTSVYTSWYKELTPKFRQRHLNLRMVMAEFVGMTFFVFIGCGTAVSFSSGAISTFADQNPEGLASNSTVNVGAEWDAVQRSIVNALKINASFGICTAMAFGVAIMCLAYSLGHISGAHFNPAVTLSLVLSGHCNIIQGAANICAQIVGSLLAAGFLSGAMPGGRSTGLGANSLSAHVTVGTAFLGEAVMTAALCFVVHMTCCTKKNDVGLMAPLAIGFTVFLAHTVLIPIDGCSINPARSLGPAIVAGKWSNGAFWVFVVGPFVGSFFAVLAWLLVSFPWDDEADVFGNTAKELEQADETTMTMNDKEHV